MGAFNWKSIDCHSLCNIKKKKSQSRNKSTCHFILLKQIFKEHVKNLRPLGCLLSIDLKYVICIDDKPVLFLGFRFWVFF